MKKPLDAVVILRIDSSDIKKLRSIALEASITLSELIRRIIKRRLESK